jgi:hypothetical protein
VDKPEGFAEIYRANVPTDTEHWHYNAYREVRLPSPAERLYVQYVGDPAVNNFHIYAHCLDRARQSASPVRITHVWSEKGQRKSKSVTLAQPGPYEINTGEEPVNESVEIAVPSGAGK